MDFNEIRHDAPFELEFEDPYSVQIVASVVGLNIAFFLLLLEVGSLDFALSLALYIALITTPLMAGFVALAYANDGDGTFSRVPSTMLRVLNITLYSEILVFWAIAFHFGVSFGIVLIISTAIGYFLNWRFNPLKS